MKSSKGYTVEFNNLFYFFVLGIAGVSYIGWWILLVLVPFFVRIKKG